MIKHENVDNQKIELSNITESRLLVAVNRRIFKHLHFPRMDEIDLLFLKNILDGCLICLISIVDLQHKAHN